MVWGGVGCEHPCLDDTAKTMLPKKRIASPCHFWFPGVLGFGIILGFRIIGFVFRIMLGCRIISFGFRITRFWLQNHPWFQNHSATLQFSMAVILYVWYRRITESVAGDFAIGVVLVYMEDGTSCLRCRSARLFGSVYMVNIVRGQPCCQSHDLVDITAWC